MKTITVDYGMHRYDEKWELDDDLFCPHCGEKAVWVEQGPGDYYLGSQHICLSCRWTFHMPQIGRGDDTDTQRIDQLLPGSAEQ